MFLRALGIGTEEFDVSTVGKLNDDLPAVLSCAPEATGTLVIGPKY